MLNPAPRELTQAQIQQTIQAIVDIQLPGGCIPWFYGGSADPWDHTEAAMALTVGGELDRARAAFRWLASTQRDDGAWAN